MNFAQLGSCHYRITRSLRGNEQTTCLFAFTLFLKGFPASERFELGSQFRRAAFSVPANILEGFARHATADRLHFLQIALASLGEVGYCIHAAGRLGYLADADRESIELHIRQVSAPLRGLMRSLGRKHP